MERTEKLTDEEMICLYKSADKFGMCALISLLGGALIASAGDSTLNYLVGGTLAGSSLFYLDLMRGFHEGILNNGLTEEQIKEQAITRKLDAFKTPVPFGP